MPEQEIENSEELLFGDSRQQEEFTPVDEGDYEVLINDITRTKSKTGRDQLKFDLKIRNDVQQKSRGRHLWYSVSRIEGDKAFNLYRINKLILTQKGRPDYQERFPGGLDEVLQYLTGKHFRCGVVIISGNDRDFNSVDDDTFVPSEWDKTHDGTTTQAEENTVKIGNATVKNADGLIDPNDDSNDLPF